MPPKDKDYGERITRLETIVEKLDDFMDDGVKYREQNTKDTALIKQCTIQISKDFAEYREECSADRKKQNERIAALEGDISFVKKLCIFVGSGVTFIAGGLGIVEVLKK